MNDSIRRSATAPRIESSLAVQSVTFKCHNTDCCPADSDGKPWGTLHGKSARLVATDESYDFGSTVVITNDDTRYTFTDTPASRPPAYAELLAALYAAAKGEPGTAFRQSEPTPPQGWDPDMGMVDHRCGFDDVRISGSSLPCSSGDAMNNKVLARGTKGRYRGYPAIVLDIEPFVIAYKRDGKWTVFSGAAPEDFV